MWTLAMDGFCYSGVTPRAQALPLLGSFRSRCQSVQGSHTSRCGGGAKGLIRHLAPVATRLQANMRLKLPGAPKEGRIALLRRPAFFSAVLPTFGPGHCALRFTAV